LRKSCAVSGRFTGTRAEMFVASGTIQSIVVERREECLEEWNEFFGIGGG
jgi:hypothetical protein